MYNIQPISIISPLLVVSRAAHSYIRTCNVGYLHTYVVRGMMFRFFRRSLYLPMYICMYDVEVGSGK